MFSDWGIGTRRLVAIAGVSAIMVVSSCGTFTPREAEEPEGQATIYVLPQKPTFVLSNLENVVNSRDVERYGELFSEDYVFIPDPSDASDLEAYYPGIFDDWDVEVEAYVGERILGDTGLLTAELNFTGETLLEDSENTYDVLKDYELWLRMEPTEEGESQWRIYIGTARLLIEREPDGLWYIQRWEDARSEAGVEAGKDTWGKLKGETHATT
jgi:ketosteroid isomerase-like protein